MNELLRRLLFLPKQASTISKQIDHLHYFIIITTFFSAFAVFLVAFWFIVRYRRRSETATTPRIVVKRWVEGLYVGGPLSVFLLWFFLGFHDFVRANTPPPGAMDIYVTGKQWMWKFTYPEGLNSINELRVPAYQPVRLLLTSRDVIHSFFVPAFRLKKDVVPGRYTELWFEATQTGTFPVYCAEYCGLNHSRMWAQIVVLEPADYAQWYRAQMQGLGVERRDALPSDREPTFEPGNLRLQGERLAGDLGCLRCHTVDGQPHIGPTWLNLYLRRERLTTGETVVADVAYLTESMMQPKAKVVAGFEPVMPSYQGQLTPLQVAALVEYIRGLTSARLETTRSERQVFVPTRDGGSPP